ncbi:GNAT family N-acetyltransferase [Pseudomonadota bacterium]
MSDHADIITIRDSRPDDAADIARIYAHHVQHSTASFEEVPPSEADIIERRACVLEFGAPYIVAELYGEVHGFAYASKFRPRSAYRHTVEDSIYVDPATTGKGIGTKLLSALIKRCTALGYRQMVAVIGGTDNVASIKVHSRLGFTQAGVMKSAGYKFGAWVDTVLLQRPLGDGDDTLPE